MQGKVLLSYMLIFIIVIITIVLVVVAYDKIEDAKISELLFLYCSNISSNGIYTQNHLTSLRQDLMKYGNYQIINRLDVHLEGNYYDTYFNDEDIIDIPLKANDKIKIVIYDNEPALVTRIIASLPLIKVSGVQKRKVTNFAFPITKTYTN